MVMSERRGEEGGGRLMMFLLLVGVSRSYLLPGLAMTLSAPLHVSPLLRTILPGRIFFLLRMLWVNEQSVHLESKTHGG